MTEAVAVEKLHKVYPANPVPAVCDLGFTVETGEVFGLLGPNGAGKSTTINMLTTRILPTSGRLTVAGVDVVAEPARARRALAVVSQRNNLDRSLTVRQNLRYHAAYHGVRRADRSRLADEMMGVFGLECLADSRVDLMSGGQAQRVMIARALMHRPRVLFLDEPATALDPQSRLFVHERVAQLRDQGVTVVLTTHDMTEAEALCDRVGVVDHGRLIALGTVPELIKTLPGHATIAVSVSGGGGDDERTAAVIGDVAGVERVETLGAGAFRLYVSSEPDAMLHAVVTAVGAAGAQLSGLEVGVPSLQDVFIHLTGRDLR